ncbi:MULTISPECIES: aliphatic sulfonate ABC transporter substrate-binding protein [Rhizobium/Agrobacterium group]|uniref:aliphatic sulfonate ABC transporter substrate-binding protein n=1 Tax=Rhizobium/Agrobacterium group TaxID=227290 RepID=UPI000B3F6834|nr:MULTISPECIES: aliphatic sulfonate ABC transporter substrate-binding protein [Rhizobium/Agrobacterium group]MCF1481086.1 aliphatic sulfonate ABC transporter substrate-binding protein [Allorhizobium ampelinum]NSZ44937.1 aliphatic sulfonate ABC transporter substrate-binding protein [Agrobacterium vitis]NTA28684.1 aliphatic sulfonate ABC transporter substrate-binding protein [Allorhizobium ampelinum]OVE93281.1 sulfonate ABC transporter substrate-binding protein [Allorhizobium ampelinum]
MTELTRRLFTTGALGSLAFSLTLGAAFRARAEGLGTLKIGYQKTGLPVIARQQGVIEAALKSQGTSVSWVEFAAGPPLVEALNVGSVHVGWTGDAPPIFGQASGAAIVYAAALPPNGKGEGIVVKTSSGIKDLAGLKGRKVAVGKGTSAHNLVVVALEKAGIGFDEITPVYLGPADAAAAFASDKVDAWAVWDPFLAIAETRYDLVTLARSSEVLDVKTYFLANRDFAARHPDTLATVLKALTVAAEWSANNRDQLAAALHEITGVPLNAQTLAANRAEFGIFKITDEIVATQQETADRFFRLGLIPKKINIKDAVWVAPTN